MTPMFGPFTHYLEPGAPVVAVRAPALLPPLTPDEIARNAAQQLVCR